jgi:hypothetical protein
MKPVMPANHRHRPSTLPNLARGWKKAKLKTEDLLALVNSEYLREEEMDLWCTTTENSYLMEKNPYEIPMFARFVERGLTLFARDFFKGMLRYYGIEYLNLNPNGIFHVSIFVNFCEAFVGIKPPLDHVPKVLLVEAIAEHGRPPSSWRHWDADA